jgi:hypothetical protein
MRTKEVKTANMSKMNCWEFKQCGREVGGDKAEELGICPAASDQMLDGVHGGKNAGRACWVVAGTLCEGKVTGTFAQTVRNCLACDFYNSVREEEQDDFTLSAELAKMLEKVA